MNQPLVASWIADGLFALAGCAVLVALWRVARPRPMFVVRVTDGKPLAVAGTVTPAFLACIREIAAAHSVGRCTVRGFADGTFIRLRFSAEVPPSARQQLRNWWASFGWRAGRGPAMGGR